MIRLGQSLIAIGFLVGALAAVISKEYVDWTMYFASFIGAVIGVAMVQIGGKKEAKGVTKIASNIGAIEASLEQLASCAEELADQREELYVYDVHQRIDDLFPEPLDQFVHARKSMIHAFSMQAYADVMNHFAAGERTINRVWSASVDGYIDEVQSCLVLAKEHFQNANNLFKELQGTS